MRPKTIIFDMDSILADFFYGIINAHEEETGIRLPPENIDTWNKVLDSSGKSLFYYFSKPGFFRHLAPIPGALETMRLCQDAGHDPIIVSSATLTHAPGEKYQWLETHAPWFDRANVFFAQRKDMISADIMIDDYPENAIAYRRAHPMAKIMGIEYPYNTHKHTRTAFDILAPSYRDFSKAWDLIRLALSSK